MLHGPAGGQRRMGRLNAQRFDMPSLFYFTASHCLPQQSHDAGQLHGSPGLLRLIPLFAMLVDSQPTAT